MNNNQISKYKKKTLITGILSLITFILTIVCFFKFSTLNDSQKDEAIYSLTALGTLLFAFLFFICIILFIIFSILKIIKIKEQTKIQLDNLKTHKDNNEETIKDENVLYQYLDDKPTSFSSYLKGNYYSGIFIFYTLLILFPLSFCLILIPLKTGFNDILMWIACILIISVLGLGLLFIFLLNPLLIYLNSKKNTLKSNIYIYEDKIRYINEMNQNNVSNNATITLDISVNFSNIIKAKKDKNSYYFIYNNEKNNKVCLILFYKDVKGVPFEFLDKKSQEINNKK